VELAGKFGVLLHFGGEPRRLWISAHPELSRIGLIGYDVEEGRPASDNLSAPLLHARLAGIEQERGGRVAILRFESAEARHKTPHVVVELIPRFANVVLVGNDERALWTRREFTGSTRRTVAAGHRYEPPSAEAGVTLAALTGRELQARLAEGDGPLHRRVPRGWGGGKNGFAHVLEEAAADEADFARRLLAVAAACATPSPRLARRDGDDAIALFPVDPGPLPGWTILPARSANDTADAYYRPREREEAEGNLLADLRRVLAKRHGRIARAVRRIEERLADAGHDADYRAQGELLAAHVGSVKRGMKSVRLPAFDGSGEVEIALDPKKDGAANVDAFFRKARRLARGREELDAEHAVQAAELAEVAEGLAALDPEPEPERLRELAKRHAPELLEARPGGAAAAGARRGGRGGGSDAGGAGGATPERPSSLPDGFMPRVYFLPGGWEVWVGRNARQNDELTHKRASQKDLWFHARGCQGSHTVLRISSGKGEPPRAIIEAAAAIAAFHSKARRSNLVPVAYTEKRYVRRPRGAPAGTAVMMREKVLMVEPKEPEDGKD
jgi:predicted ribosome quality control (RQC) complex YloA/Tae2 family protein